jgi:3-methyl-2-oxobutanoate hydroxymethyltransferase
MPFGSYSTIEDGVFNAGRLVKEAGVQAVKLEGSRPDLVERLTGIGIPVMGHLGLMPQSSSDGRQQSAGEDSFGSGRPS